MVNHEPVSDTDGFQEAEIETNRRKEGGNIRMKEQRKKGKRERQRQTKKLGVQAKEDFSSERK